MSLATNQPPIVNKCKICGAVVKSPQHASLWLRSQSRIALEIGAMAMTLSAMGWDWHNQLCPKCRKK